MKKDFHSIFSSFTIEQWHEVYDYFTLFFYQLPEAAEIDTLRLRLKTMKNQIRNKSNAKFTTIFISFSLYPPHINVMSY